MVKSGPTPDWLMVPSTRQPRFWLPRSSQSSR